MKQVYIPNNEHFWVEYYLAQAEQTGYGMPGFTGIPYQRGTGLGSFFKNLFRAILPIGKSAVKALGREALAAGANIASDVLGGKDLGDAANQHVREAAANTLRKGARTLQQGRGVGKRNATSKSIKGIKKRKFTSKDRFYNVKNFG